MSRAPRLSGSPRDGSRGVPLSAAQTRALRRMAKDLPLDIDDDLVPRIDGDPVDARTFHSLMRRGFIELRNHWGMNEGEWWLTAAGRAAVGRDEGEGQ